jgi:hypothetical protein
MLHSVPNFWQQKQMLVVPPPANQVRKQLILNDLKPKKTKKTILNDLRQKERKRQKNLLNDLKQKKRKKNQLDDFRQKERKKNVVNDLICIRNSKWGSPTSSQRARWPPRSPCCSISICKQETELPFL